MLTSLYRKVVYGRVLISTVGWVLIDDVASSTDVLVQMVTWARLRPMYAYATSAHVHIYRFKITCLPLHILVHIYIYIMYNLKYLNPQNMSFSLVSVQ